MLMHVKKNGQGCFLKKFTHTHTCVCRIGNMHVWQRLGDGSATEPHIAVKNELRKRSVCTDGRLFRCIHEGRKTLLCLPDMANTSCKHVCEKEQNVWEGLEYM